MKKQALRRNVARQIVEGLRELKRGETGRVITVPSVAEIRERTGLSLSEQNCRRGSRPPSPVCVLAWG